jgi:uncharacterized protein
MAENQNESAGIFNVLVGFGRALRQEGVAVGSGQLLTFCAAAARLDPTDLGDLYWSGRACLITRRGDVAIYDRVFRAYFLGAGARLAELLQLKAQVSPETESMLEIALGDDTGEEQPEEEHVGLMASAVETLRHKRFDDCTPEELEAVRQLMARFRLRPPRRKTRRTRPGSSHRYPDLRRTIRHGMRTQAEMIEQCWRDRRVRRRKIVLILDVSGSMTEYSRALLQFAHSAARVSSGPSGRLFGRVEVFCFGTHLTRITEASRSAIPTARWPTPPGRWSIGRAARRSVRRSTGSCGSGAAAVSAGVRSWSSAPTGWSGVIPKCSPRPWSAWPASATGSCG